MKDNNAYLADVNVDDYSQYLQVLLDTAKHNIKADVGYIARFHDKEKIILLLNGNGEKNLGKLHIGSRIALEDSLCHQVATQGKSYLLTASDTNPFLTLYDFPVKAFLAVPVFLGDDDLFGAMCFLCSNDGQHLNDNAINIVHALSQVAGTFLGHKKNELKAFEERRQSFEYLFHNNPHHMVYQPIVNLLDNKIVGIEALSRFDTTPNKPPSHWFHEAWEFGLGIDLEIRALQSVIREINNMPEDIFICINMSPLTVTSQALQNALNIESASRIVIEITEHKTIVEYAPIIEALRALKKLSIRVAIDDVGTGYSGLYHILQIKPDLLKLDISLTRNIHQDPAKQALASAIVAFSARIGATIIAEGIETKEEADALRVLGIGYGQGFYFAKPHGLPLRLQIEP
ncbi:MAG: EAL domain-containing protein [Porticoccaceae bacterium]|nr:EAL domain-containing protein [Porticoccaceae bacterium]